MEKAKVYTAFKGEKGEYTYTLFKGSVLCMKHGGVIEKTFEIMNWMDKNYIVCPHCYSFIAEEDYVLLKGKYVERQEYPAPPRS